MNPASGCSGGHAHSQPAAPQLQSSQGAGPRHTGSAPLVLLASPVLLTPLASPVLLPGPPVLLPVASPVLVGATAPLVSPASLPTSLEARSVLAAPSLAESVAGS